MGRRNNLEPRGRVRRVSGSGKRLRKKQERSFGWVRKMEEKRGFRG